MIKSEEAQKLLQDHVTWVNKWHHEWKHHRNAAEDRFWDRGTGGPSVWPVQGENIVVSGGADGQTDIFPTEVNLVRPWETSFLASLYYDGIRFVVEADELPTDEEEDDSIRLARAQAIRNLLNRFFSDPSVDDGTERLFTFGLRYRGGAATKLSLVPEHERGDNPKATEVVRFEAVPPWECVWDRRARTTKEARYRGHLFPVSMETLRAMFGGDIPEDIRGAPLPDVVEHGYSTPQTDDMQERDASYAHLFVLDDLTGMTEEDGEDGISGHRTVFLAMDLSDSPKLTELKSGPTPYSAHNGQPLSELVPFLAEPRAEYPMDAIAPVATVYELNSELNKATSIAAGAMRRDAVRVILTSDNVSSTLRDGIANAKDLEVLKTELQAGELANSVHVLEFKPMSGTLIDYLKMVRSGLQESQIIADVTRGQAGQYLSATEAAQLVQFSETTIGRYRKRSDVMLGPGVGQLYLRVLMAAMKQTEEKSIPVRVSGIEGVGVYDVTREDLDRRWKITIIETASSPNAAAQELADFQAALPTMLELAAIADPPVPVPEGEIQPPSGMQQSLALAGLDHIVELMRLPGRFDPDNLLAAAPEPPPPPPPPEVAEVPAVAPQEGAPPIDTAQLAQAPAAQAILDQAEFEQGG